MKNKGAIILIEDDKDDQDILREVLQELGVKNPLLFFDDCDKAYAHLMSTKEKPFLIFCDINLPKTNGIELKRRIDSTDTLRKKAIPFVFLTTSNTQSTVEEAYRITNLQGYFTKAVSFPELQEKVKFILDYWSAALHPKSE